MMRSVHDIVAELNREFCELFSEKRFTGYGLHGLAISAQQGVEMVPVEMNSSGEGKYVGIDDVFPLRVYHKGNSMQTRIDTKSSFGRNAGDVVNTYQLSMVVFLNRKKVGLLNDELALLIQANFPDSIEGRPFNWIRLAFRDVVLDDQRVYNQEYRTEKYLLAPEYNLFMINYQVEAAFTKGCFNKCP